MTSNFSLMSRQELRAYVLSHRDDEEALRVYMDRLHNDPDIVRYTGDCSREGLAKLEQLIIQTGAKPASQIKKYQLWMRIPGEQDQFRYEQLGTREEAYEAHTTC